MNLLFLDTETTGSSVEDGDRLVQLAYKAVKYENQAPKNPIIVNELFKPNVPISYQAMAVHHITNQDVENKPAFAGSIHQHKLQKLLEDHVLVAHNAKFDVDFIMAEGVKPKWVIDTYKTAYRHLEVDIDGNELTGHSLQYLRYALGLNEGMENAIAHDALGDIVILEKLFYYIMNQMKAESPSASPKQLLTIMINEYSQPLLLKRIKFGKHRGKHFSQIVTEDLDYIQWLATKTDLDENMRYTLNYYLS